MINSGLVSVIIPTHKGAENICRAVDSVLSQAYEWVEAIVVDDNGKDTTEQLKTQEEMRKYKDDSRVKYLVHQVNKNGSAARNTGIGAANGDYIAFLDDDDEFLEDNLEKHIEGLKDLSDDYGATYCDMLQIRPGMKNEVIGSHEAGDILKDFAKRKVAIGTSVVVFKREAMVYLKGWDESFRRHQDWEFMLRFLERYKIMHIDNVGVRRYITARHNPTNPDVVAEYRLHYMNKMKYIFEKLDKDTRQEVYDGHYSEVGKAYFKSRRLIPCLKWTFKTSSPIRCFLGYFMSGVKYLKKKTRKQTKTD